MTTVPRIVVPESVWDDFLSPDSSGMEAELALVEHRATPFFRRHGKGGKRVYEIVPEDKARELARYLGDRGGTLLAQRIDDPDDSFERASRDGYRRAIKLADEILAVLSKGVKQS